MGVRSPPEDETMTDATTTTPVPPEFAEIFRGLVMALQPRHLDRDVMQVYWNALRSVPMAALRESAARLAEGRFWPNTGDWFTVAAAMQTESRPRGYPAEGSRRLDELDALAPNDPERDEICKGLSREDQRALMARYGYDWP